MPEINRVLDAGEGGTVEFKAAAFADRSGSRDRKLTTSVLESVAAFLNTRGGVVLVGVEDDGTVLGLARDLSCMSKPDVDSWSNELSNAMHSQLGSPAASAVQIDFVAVRGQTVAALTCPALETLTTLKPARRGKDEDADARGPRILVRVATSDRKLELDEIDRYAAQRARRGDRRSPVAGTTALSGRGLAETLRRLYPDYPLLEFAGQPAPVWVQPAAREQWFDLEAPLGRLRAQQPATRGEYPSDFDPTAKPLHEYHCQTEDPPRKFNGATFALDRIRRKGQELAIDCTLGRYFVSLATADALDNELLDAQAAAPEVALGLAELPRRGWLHERVDDPVLDGSRRSAAVSVGTAVIFATPRGGWAVFVAPRSAEVATHALLNHVAPSGILSPLDDGFTPPEEEFSVRRTVLREFAEELYDDNELDVGSQFFHDIDDVPEIRRLAELVATDAADLLYTGVSVNLLTLRPEIGTLLLVRDPDWIRRESSRELTRPMRSGWEYLRREAAGQLRGRDYISALPLDAAFLPTAKEQLGPSALVPNAAAALALAAPVAAERV